MKKFKPGGIQGQYDTTRTAKIQTRLCICSKQDIQTGRKKEGENFGIFSTFLHLEAILMSTKNKSLEKVPTNLSAPL